jgi:folate-binding protein YgfZ
MSDAGLGYRRFKESGGVADLSGRCKLRLTGADRVRFLNGQVTANVTRLGPGHALPACITTAKGKLCGEAILHATADALLVDADASLRATLPARLERYLISDDVAIEDLTDSLHLIHLLGAVAPGADLTAHCVAADRVRRFGHDGWDLLLLPAAFAAVWPSLTRDLVELDPALQEVIRIEAGVPRWGAELDEDTLPAEAGLDHTHIDYHKGCYIGQEVISRLKSVGHVNRQLTGLISRGGPLAPGAALFAPGDDARPIGSVTSGAFSFALEKHVALGYLRRGAGFPEVIARSADPAGPDTVVAPHPLPLVS